MKSVSKIVRLYGSVYLPKYAVVVLANSDSAMMDLVFTSYSFTLISTLSPSGITSCPNVEVVSSQAAHTRVKKSIPKILTFMRVVPNLIYYFTSFSHTIS